MIRYAPWWGGWRMLLRLNGQTISASSSAPNAVGLNIVPCSELSEEKHVTNSNSEDNSNSMSDNLVNEVDQPFKSSNAFSVKSKVQRSSNLVTAAFASLRNKEEHTPNLNDEIAAANTVDALLSFSKSPSFSRSHALKIVSILSDWTAAKKVILSDFERDPRFIDICRLLGQHISSPGGDPAGLGDLATVLGITGDYEAAKLVSTISVSQTIRIMSTLAQKKRRSPSLLQALANNISNCKKVLNIKQGADILYAMAVLNFPDDVLLKKVSADICVCLPDNDRPAVVGSVLTSLGILRYKDVVLLDALSEWVEKHHSVCRVYDLVALLLTLAKVNHSPVNNDSLFKVVLPQVTSGDVSRPAAWLDVVWALAVLGQADHSHLESVLNPDSVEKLIITNGDNNGNGIPPATGIKLLNVNAVAKNTVGYKGPLLPLPSKKFNVTLKRSREKQLLMSSVMDSFSNLLPSATYLRTNIETDMGFLIDGECVVDTKCNPLPVEESTPEKSTKKRIRVAVLVWDYNDMCRGRQDPTGGAILNSQLLTKNGYKVLSVPYTKFNPREKLVARVRYLEQQLKSIARTVS